MFTRGVLFLLLLSVFSLPVAAAPQTDCVYYFYSQECLGCASLEVYFSSLQKEHPNLNLQKFEVYHNYQNFQLLQEYFKSYNIPEESQAIPVVFIGDSYFVGAEAIVSFVEKRIEDNRGSACPVLDGKKTAGIIGRGEPSNVLSTLTFSRVTSAAIQNMFHPGMLALALVLLALLSGTKIEVRKGLLYVAGVYTSYLFFGLGFLSWLYKPGLNFLFYKTIGVIAVIAGLAGANSFFGTWDAVVNTIPADIQRYWKKVMAFLHTAPGFYLTGLLLSLCTFASVSSSFFLMRGIFADRFMPALVLPLILYYLVVMVLLLVALLLLFNAAEEKLETAVASQENSSDMKRAAWKKHYTRLLDFVLRMVLLAVGLILIFV